MGWKYVQRNDETGAYRTTSEGGGGSSSHSYSATEQEIGTWVDGSTIYEKTTHVTSITANDDWQNIENIGASMLVNFECICLQSGGNSGNQSSFRSDRNAPQIRLNSSGVLQYSLISGTSISELYVTAQYIKSSS